MRLLKFRNYRVLEQRMQEAEANLAVIARIRPPAEYKESHLILYAQEKLNLLILKLYQRQFASMTAEVTSPQESVIHVMQQLFQDPDFLSMGLLIYPCCKSGLKPCRAS
ncbi:MAG: hypothetical protein IGS03_02720 [Candidatus Sericytochromatia bacterium]|nr:hypothetical protein [Candidatus Sericytochromatia bacterium]